MIIYFYSFLVKVLWDGEYVEVNEGNYSLFICKIKVIIKYNLEILKVLNKW